MRINYGFCWMVLYVIKILSDWYKIILCEVIILLILKNYIYMYIYNLYICEIYNIYFLSILLFVFFCFNFEINYVKVECLEFKWNG